MAINEALLSRANNCCELCGKLDQLTTFSVPAEDRMSDGRPVVICTNCAAALDKMPETSASNWRFLSDAIWSPVSEVQVLSYKLLNSMREELWVQEILDQLYLEEDVKNWATRINLFEPQAKHVDANGHALAAGDTVTLIKDLSVKGGGFTAKRGTAVRKIRLDPNDVGYIEGKVNDQTIAIKTAFVKKS